MSDFAYDYFNSELEKLDIPSLQEIFDKVQRLLLSKKAEQSDSAQIDKAEVERINAVYSKIPENEQLASCQASMQTMWEAVKNDTWWNLVLITPQIGAVPKTSLVEKVSKLSPNMMKEVDRALIDFLKL